MVLKHLKRKLLKRFCSDADKLLSKLNHNLPASQSVKHEIDKHEKLHTKRDHPIEANKEKDMWD